MNEQPGAGSGLANPRAVVEVVGVRKSFGPVRALVDATMTVHSGEIHALLGVNGAGKSTLVKVLTGVLRPDRGELRWKGRRVVVPSPAVARRLGIGAVFQETALIPDLNFAENLKLVGVTTQRREIFEGWLRHFGLSTPSGNKLAKEVPLPVLRVIDLARALAFAPSLLVLDELTAELSNDLSERVFDGLERYRGSGGSIIYVSHRLAEVRRVCRVATVLRNGETVGASLRLDRLVDADLFELMVGSAARVELGPRHRVEGQARSTSRPVLSVDSVRVKSKVQDVSFEVWPGEIVGLAALQDQGAEELFEAIAGLLKPDGGEVRVGDRVVRAGSVAAAITAGLVFVPAERARALLPTRSVLENVALALDTEVRRWLRPLSQQAQSRSAEAVSRLAIDMRAGQQVRRLSGGNRQKVVVARWLAAGFKVLLAFDPTRGIDIATKAEIYALLRELAGADAAALVYSSELAELVGLCNRVVVLYRGKVQAEFSAADLNENALVRACHGLATEVAMSPPAEPGHGQV